MEPAFAMRPTPGYTSPNLSELPLASEGEATLGPPEWNPYEDSEVPPEDYPFFEGVQPEPGLPMADRPRFPRF